MSLAVCFDLRASTKCVLSDIFLVDFRGDVMYSECERAQRRPSGRGTEEGEGKAGEYELGQMQGEGEGMVGGMHGGFAEI